MALADPQSVTYDGTAYTLNRVSSGSNQSSYQALATGLELDLTVSHQYGKRTRRMAKLTLKSVTASPFATGISLPLSHACYLVIDTAADFGIQDPAVAVKQINALTTWFTASTNANALNLVKGLN